MDGNNVAQIISSSQVKQLEGTNPTISHNNGDPNVSQLLINNPPPPLPLTNNSNQRPSHYSEARFLYRFLYLRTREGLMTTHFQRQTYIDKFCSFHGTTGTVEYTEFVVHLPMRGRPSIFKPLPTDGLLNGPLPLPTKLRDFANFYQHQEGYKFHDNSDFKTQVPVQTMHEFIMERILNRTRSLAGMFLDAHQDVNFQLRSYLLQNYAYYAQEERLSRQLEEQNVADTLDSNTRNPLIPP